MDRVIIKSFSWREKQKVIIFAEANGFIYKEGSLTNTLIIYKTKDIKPIIDYLTKNKLGSILNI